MSLQTSRKELINCLLQFVIKEGRLPKKTDEAFVSLVPLIKDAFGSWNCALEIAGFKTDNDCPNALSIAELIRRALDLHPMTFNELEKKLSHTHPNIKFSSLSMRLQQCSGVKSIGPRRSKIYFIINQENLAKEKLNKNFSIISENEDFLFNCLKKPLTKEQIYNLDPKITKNHYDKWLKDLYYSRIICKVHFIARARGGGKYGASDLFGKIACQNVYCRFDCPEEMIEYIVSNMPKININNSNFLRSLNYRLKTILPTEIFKVWKKIGFAKIQEEIRDQDATKTLSEIGIRVDTPKVKSRIQLSQTKLYKNRSYLIDAKTGKHLSTTVMYLGDKKIVGVRNVLDKLREVLLVTAEELGGKNLKTRDFIDLFNLRGPSYGDVIRKVFSEFEAQGKIHRKNIGSENKPLYVYDLAEQNNKQADQIKNQIIINTIELKLDYKRDKLALEAKFKLLPSKTAFSKIKADLWFDNTKIKSVLFNILHSLGSTAEFLLTTTLKTNEVKPGPHAVKVEMVEVSIFRKTLACAIKETIVEYHPLSREERLRKVLTIKKIEDQGITVVSENDKEIYQELENSIKKIESTKQDKW